MVGDETEDSALRIHGSFVIERAIFKVKAQMSRYAVATHNLDEIANREDLALLRSQREEAV